ncbi:MAG: hypothetical protein ACC656_03935 [Candidatus Heimdallarchaeota archaeon]
MIRGVEQKEIPYVLEDDRSSPVEDQTVFWISPKTGHDNNKTLQRYSMATKTNRKGYQEINPNKMDVADQEEFLHIVSKVENYGFPEDHTLYAKHENGVLKESTEPGDLKEVARTLAADHLAEILEVSNNISKLTEGSKKNSSS